MQIEITLPLQYDSDNTVPRDVKLTAHVDNVVLDIYNREIRINAADLRRALDMLKEAT